MPEAGAKDVWNDGAGTEPVLDPPSMGAEGAPTAGARGTPKGGATEGAANTEAAATPKVGELPALKAGTLPLAICCDPHPPKLPMLKVGANDAEAGGKVNIEKPELGAEAAPASANMLVRVDPSGGLLGPADVDGSKAATDAFGAPRCAADAAVVAAAPNAPAAELPGLPG